MFSVYGRMPSKAGQKPPGCFELPATGETATPGSWPHPGTIDPSLAPAALPGQRRIRQAPPRPRQAIDCSVPALLEWGAGPADNTAPGTAGSRRREPAKTGATARSRLDFLRWPHPYGPLEVNVTGAADRVMWPQSRFVPAAFRRHRRRARLETQVNPRPPRCADAEHPNSVPSPRTRRRQGFPAGHLRAGQDPVRSRRPVPAARGPRSSATRRQHPR